MIQESRPPREQPKKIVGTDLPTWLTYNNPRSGEYQRLHRELMKKYGAVRSSAEFYLRGWYALLRESGGSERTRYLAEKMAGRSLIDLGADSIFYSMHQKAAKKGVIKKNTASRRLSRLHKTLNQGLK